MHGGDWLWASANDLSDWLMSVSSCCVQRCTALSTARLTVGVSTSSLTALAAPLLNQFAAIGVADVEALAGLTAEEIFGELHKHGNGTR